MSRYVFAERLPRTARRERLLADLRGDAWIVALSALYLSDGRYPPRERRGGCYFGFCSTEGEWCDPEAATHVGWTLTP